MDLLAREKKIKEELKEVIERFAPDMSIADFNKLANEFIKDSGIVDLLNMACKSNNLEEVKDDLGVVQKLKDCFAGSYVNSDGEFIAHERANEYFILRNCETELDVKCKVLEWFSSGAYKREPYRTKKKNDEFHAFMLNGINQFLGTEFTADDIKEIYTYLGNACNHEKTIQFIESDYDMSILTI